MLNDELIDAIANTCWYHQGLYLKKGKELPCICGALKDMVYLTMEITKKDLTDTPALVEHISFSLSATITSE